CDMIDVGARKELDVRVVSPVDNLLEAHFDAIWGSAYDQLLDLVRSHETTLIFTNSRYKTERTSLRLNERADGIDMRSTGSTSTRVLQVGAHHGSMSKKVRLDMENRLKTGQLDALVATSSLELGIDVGSIDLVCQIQSPKSVSSGMQRIGRAGHLLDATSKGRLLVTDRDDLVESAVLVRAIVDGQIDTTRVPLNCLDVLAQHVVGAVAADPWPVDVLFDLCRHAYCFYSLDRADYDRILEMLSGGYTFEMEYPPYAKIGWDKVNQMLYPEPAARMIAFRASGTIPDVSDYDVYFEARKTVVGRLGESFVEELHTGDIFILGSSSWRVLRIHRNRVIVEDVYGKAPTIPFWFGDRPSRTCDLGRLVGRFRREMTARLDELGPQGFVSMLQEQYLVNEDGALSIREYLHEQQLVMGDVPSDERIVIEHFLDELGQQQIVIHSSFGIRVNDPWSMALRQAIEERYGLCVNTATNDDGILITVRRAGEDEVEASERVDIDVPALLQFVSPRNLDVLLEKAVLDSPLFKSRFRHNAVRSMMVLREYKGRRTPVWLQGLRASGFLKACIDIPDFPLIAETLRECMHESLDVPNLRRVIDALDGGEIEVRTVESRIPSPFVHSLLLLGQYGEIGSIPIRERRGRLMHLHRELLRQILDEETLRNLLDEDAVREVDDRLQRKHPKRARNANELARILLELGDLVEAPDNELSLVDRVDGNAMLLLDELMTARRAVLVPIPTAETHRDRWIATENFSLYRDAFATAQEIDVQDRALLDLLARDGLLTAADISLLGDGQDRLERLVRAYYVLRVVRDWRVAYVAADAWVPEHIKAEKRTRQDEARQELVFRFARWHGPFTKYEVMERYGFAESWVEAALADLVEQGSVVQGEYVPTKSFPQWCYRPNLEEIHHLTLKRLRKEMEPASPAAFADFLVRWQHHHPATQLAGMDGLREVLRQIQGQENYQIVYERDVFYKRVKDYDPSMLDRLCYSGEMRCINPHIQKKKINLHITHRGWVRPIVVTPETDLDMPEFETKVLEQFERSRTAIDALLDERKP
ncbi:MAG: hypothetical protein JXA89_03810, partial [Anaerolineae bacterium]|nr:hypothetical protein [Anaerolineae bacterium]